METREIYRLAYRIARCSLSIMAWADNFHEAYEFDDMMTGDVLKQIARIDRQREAYAKSLTTWAALGELDGDDQLIDDIDDSAGRSLLAGNAGPYQNLMHRAMSRWSTTRIGDFNRDGRRDFLNEYACLLLNVKTERLRNPTRYQLKYHWLTKATPIGKGE